MPITVKTHIILCMSVGECWLHLCQWDEIKLKANLSDRFQISLHFHYRVSWSDRNDIMAVLPFSLPLKYACFLLSYYYYWYIELLICDSCFHIHTKRLKNLFFRKYAEICSSFSMLIKKRILRVEGPRCQTVFSLHLWNIKEELPENLRQISAERGLKVSS